MFGWVINTPLCILNSKTSNLLFLKNYMRRLRDLVPFVNVKNTHEGKLLLVKLQAEANSFMYVFHVF